MRSYSVARKWGSIVAVLVLIALAFILMLSFAERAFVYHPHPYRANYRQLLSGGVTELPFSTSVGREMAFYIPPRNGSALPDRIWVAFCGNGSLALDWLPITSLDPNLGDAFLLIDYPGYGNSEGSANTRNTGLAADGALAALAARLNVPEGTLESRLNAMGHSLGAAVALDFARRHQVGTIILLAPFTSLREEAAYFIGGPLSHLLRDNYDNRAALGELAKRRPPPRVIIFHGLDDAMIPPEMGRELADQFPDFVTFRGIAGADHDSVVAAAEEKMVAIMSEKTAQPGVGVR